VEDVVGTVRRQEEGVQLCNQVAAQRLDPRFADTALGVLGHSAALALGGRDSPTTLAAADSVLFGCGLPGHDENLIFRFRRGRGRGRFLVLVHSAALLCRKVDLVDVDVGFGAGVGVDVCVCGADTGADLTAAASDRAFWLADSTAIASAIAATASATFRVSSAET